MGHQYFERMSGELIRSFQIEMAQPVLDPQRAADTGVKAVFNRVVALHAAGDLRRSVEAAAAVVLPPGTNAQQAALAAVGSDVFGQLRRACTFPDEAERVALALVREVHRALLPGAPSMTDAFRAACRLFADQIARSEAVFRLAKDGPDATDGLARRVANEIADRAQRRIEEAAGKNPRGFKRGEWRAPRARSSGRTNEEKGGINVG